MATPRRVAIYARVSTDTQTAENQLRELREVAARSGWEVVEEYIDHGISGAKGRDKRPAFDRLFKDATRKKFSMVVAWSVDRLGRSLQDLIGFLTELHAIGCHLYLHQQAVDTTTPAGKALFQMMGVFAEFERAMIQERVKAGLARALAQGKELGRPSVIDPELIGKVQTLRTEGLGIIKIGKALGIGTGTAQKVIRSLEAA